MNSLLLRLVLAFALLLNGLLPPAMHAHAMPLPDAPVAEAEAQAGCHEVDAAAVQVSVDAVAEAAAESADCCAPGLCDCACTAAAALLPAVLARLAPPLAVVCPDTVAAYPSVRPDLPLRPPSIA
ncbi:MAG: CopL family metal-binding regulatory protein [Moraxellaceae bacterium]